MNEEHYPTPPEPPRFATFIPGRSPSWKYYSNIGHAKSAMHSGAAGYQRFYPAELWILEADGKWSLAINTRGLDYDPTFKNTGDQLRDLMKPFTNAHRPN